MKKRFNNNPALAYMSAQNDLFDVASEVIPQEALHVAQEVLSDVAQEVAQQDAHKVVQHENGHRQYIRTQGRKGFKKPRINLALDSVDLQNEVRARAELEGMSITQLINEAVYQYLEASDSCITILKE